MEPAKYSICYIRIRTGNTIFAEQQQTWSKRIDVYYTTPYRRRKCFYRHEILLIYKTNLESVVPIFQILSIIND
ncbi:hypothetical protein BIY37_12695 [Candidatus Brocadia sapporoensis]|uniref:Uncharacterized protein n=1 Tax=Candidatus Brocadia sapporoensis TaxID=392547 RepID=A0A1V6LWQ1_9BACT|nr:hypothetical protein BIY37_12695 [Candidatus Brocadia sapporoensis]